MYMYVNYEGLFRYLKVTDYLVWSMYAVYEARMCDLSYTASQKTSPRLCNYHIVEYIYYNFHNNIYIIISIIVYCCSNLFVLS